jgi:MYXO-CTERM domain-containing protein
VSGDTWTEVAASLHHYCTLAIHGPRLELTAYLTDGSVLDSYVLGDDLTECSISPATECASFTPATCADGEAGAWQCVEGGCIYNCAAESAPPDGGAGGGGSGSGGSGPGGSGPGGSGANAIDDDDGDGDGGCGCRVGRSGAGAALAWAVGLALIAARRRRRTS